MGIPDGRAETNALFAVEHVIGKDRDCKDDFVRWRQGFSPKEHREMMDRERMLRWQAEREEADRSYRLKESGANADARKEEIRLIRTGVWVAVGAIAIGAIATIVGALIEAGIIS